MAEAVFQQQVREAGLASEFEIDSAGTGGWHEGQPADSRALALLERQGIAYEGRARQISREDLYDYDYVLAMDDDNLSDLRRLAGGRRSHIRLFLDAAHKAGTVSNTQVPDPYYDGTFQRVYDLVSKGSAELLAEIRRDHDL
jgi:protein-tyrosine phosphatase